MLDVSVLLLTGTVATGKTVVARAIGELLGEAGRGHVLVDLDQLGMAFVPDRPDGDVLQLRIDNLGAIWPNLLSAGVRFVVIAGAVSTAEVLGSVRDAIGGADMTVVRLVTPPSLLEARLRARDNGRLLRDHLAVTAAIDASLDGAELEDFRVTNDEQPPRRVAMSVARLIGWA